MNNATAIRALAAIVVVVLIFTTGSLAAATSSFTPQSQKLICTHPGNNATFDGLIVDGGCCVISFNRL